MLPSPAARSTQAGFALPAVLFLVLLLGGLSVGLLEEGIAARKAVVNHEANLLALEIAEAGVVRAEVEVRTRVDSATDGIGFASGPFGNGEFSVALAADPISEDRSILSAAGTHGLSTRRIEVGVRRRANRRFVEALFAKDDLVFNGETGTDAYDSSLGTYASQATSSDGGGAYAAVGGHIGSNAGITLTGSAVWVRGNAIPGPLQEVVRNGNPTVLGDMAPRLAAIDLPNTSYAQFLAAYQTNDNGSLVGPGGGGGADGKGKGNGNGKGGNGGGGGGVTYDPTTYSLSLTGGANLNLAPGTYFFRSISMAGNSTLSVSSGVTIYVTGSMDLTGGTLLNSGRPQDFQVFAHPYPLPVGFFPTATQVRVRGGSQTALALYGPSSDFTIMGGGDLFGAVVAESITVAGDSFFHYDRSLGEIGGEGIATMERLYWREPTPPNR
jgi:hypothetical protein